VALSQAFRVVHGGIGQRFGRGLEPVVASALSFRVLGNGPLVNILPSGGAPEERYDSPRCPSFGGFQCQRLHPCLWKLHTLPGHATPGSVPVLLPPGRGHHSPMLLERNYRSQTAPCAAVTALETPDDEPGRCFPLVIVNSTTHRR